jgi:hypothetical protein
MKDFMEHYLDFLKSAFKMVLNSVAEPHHFDAALAPAARSPSLLVFPNFAKQK